MFRSIFGGGAKTATPESEAPAPAPSPQTVVASPHAATTLPSSSNPSPQATPSAPKFVPKPSNLSKPSMFAGMNFKATTPAATAAPAKVKAPGYVPVSLMVGASKADAEEGHEEVLSSSVQTADKVPTKSSEGGTVSYAQNKQKQSQVADDKVPEEQESAFGFIGEDDEEEPCSPPTTTAATTPATATSPPATTPTPVERQFSDWDAELATAAATLVAHYERVRLALADAHHKHETLRALDAEISAVGRALGTTRLSMEAAVAADRFEDADTLLQQSEVLERQGAALTAQLASARAELEAANAYVETLSGAGGVEEHLSAMQLLEEVMAEEHERYAAGQAAQHEELSGHAQQKMREAEAVLAEVAALLEDIAAEEDVLERAVAADCAPDLELAAELTVQEHMLEEEVEELLRQLHAKQEALEAVRAQKDECGARVQARRERGSEEMIAVAARKQEAEARRALGERALAHARAVAAENAQQRKVTERNAQRAARDMCRARVLRGTATSANTRRAVLARAYRAYKQAQDEAYGVNAAVDASLRALRGSQEELEGRVGGLHSRQAELLKAISELDAQAPVLASEKRAAVAAKDFRLAASITARVNEAAEARAQAERDVEAVRAELAALGEEIARVEADVVMHMERAETKRATKDKDLALAVAAVGRAMGRVEAAARAAAARVARVARGEEQTDFERHAFPESGVSEGDHCAALSIGRVGRTAQELTRAVQVEAEIAGSARVTWEKEAVALGCANEVAEETVREILGADEHACEVEEDEEEEDEVETVEEEESSVVDGADDTAIHVEAEDQAIAAKLSSATEETDEALMGEVSVSEAAEVETVEAEVSAATKAAETEAASVSAGGAQVAEAEVTVYAEEEEDDVMSAFLAEAEPEIGTGTEVEAVGAVVDVDVAEQSHGNAASHIDAHTGATAEVEAETAEEEEDVLAMFLDADADDAEDEASAVVETGEANVEAAEGATESNNATHITDDADVDATHHRNAEAAVVETDESEATSVDNADDVTNADAVDTVANVAPREEPATTEKAVTAEVVAAEDEEGSFAALLQDDEGATEATEQADAEAESAEDGATGMDEDARGEEAMHSEAVEAEEEDPLALFLLEEQAEAGADAEADAAVEDVAEAESSDSTSTPPAQSMETETERMEEDDDALALFMNAAE